jgi:hypothetical protein
VVKSTVDLVIKHEVITPYFTQVAETGQATPQEVSTTHDN